MSHYEERLQMDLDEIRVRLEDISDRVVRATGDAVRAVVQGDRPLGNMTILRDRAVNRGVRKLDRLCHVFVVRHSPSAGHLRWVSSVLRMTVALERVGDYAAAVCRESVRFSGDPPRSILDAIGNLGRGAELVLRQSLEAFREGDVDLARATADQCQDVDEDFKRAYHTLIESAAEDDPPIKDALALGTVLRTLMRVSDQAANVCQHTLFTVSGEVKEKKVFRIMFVDERNEGMSQLAEAYARRAFPDSGSYSSAGWSPAEALPDAVTRFLSERGLGSDPRPKALAARDDRGNHYHIIIGLEGDPLRHLDSLPFLTASLAWDVGAPLTLDGPDPEKLIEAAYHRVGTEICDLMEMLVGSDGE